MCVCTPEIRTPFCGKPGCAWPEQQKAPPRRLARFTISPEVLVTMCAEGAHIHAKVVANGLPADAKIVRVMTDECSLTITAILESEAFAPVEDGARIPDLAPTVFGTLVVPGCCDQR